MKTSTKAPNKADAEIGAKIRARRLARGMSLVQLAHAVGITYQQIQKYEKGGSRVSSGRLSRIAAALDVPITVFFNVPHGQAVESRNANAAPLILDTPGVAALLRAFSGIEDRSVRRAFVALAECAAGYRPRRRGRPPA